MHSECCPNSLQEIPTAVVCPCISFREPLPVLMGVGYALVPDTHNFSWMTLPTAILVFLLAYVPLNVVPVTRLTMICFVLFCFVVYILATRNSPDDMGDD